MTDFNSKAPTLSGGQTVQATTLTAASGLTVGNNGGFLVVTPAGNVGIGSTTPAYTLDVSGSAYVHSNMFVGCNLDVSGSALVTGSLTANAFVGNGSALTGVVPGSNLSSANIGTSRPDMNNLLNYVSNGQTLTNQTPLPDFAFTGPTTSRPTTNYQNTEYGGNYTISASTYIPGYEPWKITTGGSWRSGSNMTSGTYTGAIAINVIDETYGSESTFGTNFVINSDWLQFDFPKPMLLSKFTMNGDGTTLALPGTYYLIGSSDGGITWYFIYWEPGTAPLSATNNTFSVYSTLCMRAFTSFRVCIPSLNSLSGSSPYVAVGACTFSVRASDFGLKCLTPARFEDLICIGRFSTLIATGINFGRFTIPSRTYGAGVTLTFIIPQISGMGFASTSLIFTKIDVGSGVTTVLKMTCMFCSQNQSLYVYNSSTSSITDALNIIWLSIG